MEKGNWKNKLSVFLFVFENSIEFFFSVGTIVFGVTQFINALLKFVVVAYVTLG